MPNIQKKETGVAQGSVYDVAERQGRDLTDVLAFADTVILYDHSGSMGGWKEEKAREALIELQRTHDGDILLIAFDSVPKMCYDGQPPSAGGSTALHLALDYAKELDIPGRRFILISDGAPDRPEETLKIARTYTCPIHTIYIGPDGGSGLLFMNQLTALNGASQNLGQKDVAQLAAVVAGLLPEGRTHA